MNEKSTNKKDDNLKERLDKIIEQKSTENSALNNLLQKIYQELDELDSEVKKNKNESE